ncbi:MAG: TIGR00282 family metallophosphoesterase [bacterium]|nr:TIGR00282 family metallophosphoesterase [bacterium]
MKILFFGDVFGRPGREALAKIIPEWKAKYSPDIIIANAENISHGAGISENSIREVREAGIDIMTGGNHSLEGKNAAELLNNHEIPIVRPENLAKGSPGRGFKYFEINNKNLLVINLIGQVHMRQNYDSPWTAADRILKQNEAGENAKHIIVDWHADVTAEKIAMGWYLDGKVSAVLGTHSHTPTADERILPKRTAFISDVGMTGAHYSIIGQEIETNLKRYRTNSPVRVDVASAPPYETNAVLIELDDENGRATKIERLRKILE